MKQNNFHYLFLLNFDIWLIYVYLYAMSYVKYWNYWIPLAFFSIIKCVSVH